MSIQPLLIDNVAFAKRNESLSGSLQLADCPRLAELLQTQQPKPQSTHSLSVNDVAVNVIQYKLSGETNAVGQHFLHLSLNSSLMTYCQRCLELMQLHLSLNFHYMIRDEHFDDLDVDYAEDSDDFDVQEASQVMDLYALIEDEIMMAAPIAPMHENDCLKAPMQSGDKPNPFAVLKGLIKP